MPDDRVVVPERRRGLRLSIAGVSVAIESDDRDLHMQLPDVEGRFAADGAWSDLTLRAQWSTLTRQDEPAPVFDSGVWRLRRVADHFLFQFASPFLGPIPYKTARIDSTFSAGEVLLHQPYFADRTIYPLEYPLDELLFVHLLARGRGVELHGSAVVDGCGAASLFVGQSGAGKSTMARLWQPDADVTILSDERVVVRDIGGRMVVYGTPWHGDEPLASAGPAPVGRIFFLRHGSAHRLTQTTASEAAARLFACSFMPFYDPKAVAFTLSFVAALAERVPCHEIQFTPDASVVDFVRRSVA